MLDALIGTTVFSRLVVLCLAFIYVHFLLCSLQSAYLLIRYRHLPVPFLRLVVLLATLTPLLALGVKLDLGAYFDYVIPTSKSPDLAGFVVYILIVYFEVAIFGLCVFCFNWPRLEKPTSGGDGTNCVVIVCHNSSNRIRKTLERALRCLQPYQIFVADNGSSKREIQKSREICALVSREYRILFPEYSGDPITYACIDEPSKTIAQFTVLCSLYFSSKYHFKYVTLLDDDTFLPDEWTEHIIHHYFSKDPQVKTLAYPLSPPLDNKSTSTQHYQHYEYLIAAFTNYVRSNLGTVLFASGAVSTWHVDVLVDVIVRHDSLFHGEDLQLGLLLHCIGGRWRMSMGQGGGYKIGWIPMPIGTDTPVHFMHWWDIFPSTFRIARGRKCECTEKSLFVQRVKCWEPARHFFLIKFLRVLVHRAGFTSWPSVFAKILCLWEIFFIVLDWTFIAWLVYFSIHYESMALVFASGILSWSLFLLVSDLFIFKDLHPNVGPVDFSISITMPVLYKLPMVVLRLLGVLYNLLWYLPFESRGERIIERVRGGDRRMFDNLGNCLPPSTSNSTRMIENGSATNSPASSIIEMS